MLKNRTFPCPNCSAVDRVLIHGIWVNDEFQKLVFDIAYNDNEELIASLNKTRSTLQLEDYKLPRALVLVEQYAAEVRKFQCINCNKIFIIPLKKVNGSTNTNVFLSVGEKGLQRNQLEELFLKKFSTDELTLILHDMGNYINFVRDEDKITCILNKLYE